MLMTLWAVYRALSLLARDTWIKSGWFHFDSGFLCFHGLVSEGIELVFGVRHIYQWHWLAVLCLCFPEDLKHAIQNNVRIRATWFPCICAKNLMTLTTAISIAREVSALYSNVTRYVVTVWRISIQLPAEVLKSNQAKQTLHTCLAGPWAWRNQFFFLHGNQNKQK